MTIKQRIAITIKQLAACGIAAAPVDKRTKRDLTQALKLSHEELLDAEEWCCIAQAIASTWRGDYLTAGMHLAFAHNAQATRRELARPPDKEMN